MGIGHVSRATFLAAGGVSAALLAGSACERPEPGGSPAVTAAASSQPHGSHDPLHGGIVSMTADMHFETVLERAGKHRIYWSDAARNPLPASAVAAVALHLERPGAEAEHLTLSADPSGKYWIAAGKPLEDPSAVAVTVAFDRAGQPTTRMTVQRAAAAPSATASAAASATASASASSGHEGHDHTH